MVLETVLYGNHNGCAYCSWDGTVGLGPRSRASLLILAVDLLASGDQSEKKAEKGTHATDLRRLSNDASVDPDK